MAEVVTELAVGRPFGVVVMELLTEPTLPEPLSPFEDLKT
tara:strand:- start:155 stop:274 length:120 start_codon:yes stop_codon:yes gene_type:complete